MIRLVNWTCKLVHIMYISLQPHPTMLFLSWIHLLRGKKSLFFVFSELDQKMLVPNGFAHSNCVHAYPFKAMPQLSRLLQKSDKLPIGSPVILPYMAFERQSYLCYSDIFSKIFPLKISQGSLTHNKADAVTCNHSAKINIRTSFTDAKTEFSITYANIYNYVIWLLTCAEFPAMVSTLSWGAYLL